MVVMLLCCVSRKFSHRRGTSLCAKSEAGYRCSGITKFFNFFQLQDVEMLILKLQIFVKFDFRSVWNQHISLGVWVRTRSVGRFQGLVGQYIFLRKQDFCFYYMFKTNFSGRYKIGRYTAPECLPWLRTWSERPQELTIIWKKFKTSPRKEYSH